MALKYTGTGIFKYGLDVQGQFPLDSRIIVQNASDLTSYKTLFVSGGVPTWYVGMTVFAEDTKKLYVLQSEAEGFAPVGADESQLANLFNYVGNVDSFESLPTSGLKKGDVYNVVSAFEIEIPGEGLEDSVKEQYPAGTNVVWNGTGWDPLAGSIDLSGYATKIELNTLDGKVAENISDIAALDQNLQTLSSDVANKVDKVEGSSLITSDKLALIDTNAADIAALRVQIGLNPDGTPGENASLETRVGAAESEIDALQSDNNTNKTDIANLKSDNETNKTNISTLQSWVTTNESLLTEAVAANAKQTADIAELSGKVTTLETGVSGLTTTTGTHTTQISEANTKINGIDGRVATIEADYLKAADINGKLDASVYEEKISELESADSNNLQEAKSYADDLKVTIDAAYAAADAKTLQDAKSYADSLVYNDTELTARVKANEDALLVLNGADTVDGSVAKQVKDAINKFATDVTNDETIDTFKELVDYAASHNSEYATLAGTVQSNTTALEVLNGNGAGSVAKAVKDAVDAEAAIARAAEEANANAIKAISDDYLKAEHKTALEGLITTETNRATGVEGGLDARLLVVEGDYLKAADKSALQLSIDSKVDQSAYDTEIAKLKQADADTLQAAKDYTDTAFEWIDVK